MFSGGVELRSRKQILPDTRPPYSTVMYSPYCGDPSAPVTAVWKSIDPEVRLGWMNSVKVVNAEPCVVVKSAGGEVEVTATPLVEIVTVTVPVVPAELV